MRLATFNLRGGGSARSWTALARLGADLLFVQEAKDPGSVAVDGEPAIHGGSWAPVPHGRWGSGLRVSVAGVLDPIEVPGFAGWVSGGRVGLGGVTLTAFSVHVPSGRGSYVRVANQLLDALLGLSLEGPMVLGGDWNVATVRRTPDDPIRWTRGERLLLDRLEGELGLVSAWPVANPGRTPEQTLRWTNAPTLAYHCDGIFIPAGWTAALHAAEVLQGEPWRTLSDHNPVVVALDRARIPGMAPPLLT